MSEKHEMSEPNVNTNDLDMNDVELQKHLYIYCSVLFTERLMFLIAESKNMVPAMGRISRHNILNVMAHIVRSIGPHGLTAILKLGDHAVANIVLFSIEVLMSLPNEASVDECVLATDKHLNGSYERLMAGFTGDEEDGNAPTAVPGEGSDSVN